MSNKLERILEIKEKTEQQDSKMTGEPLVLYDKNNLPREVLMLYDEMDVPNYCGSY